MCATACSPSRSSLAPSPSRKHTKFKSRGRCPASPGTRWEEGSEEGAGRRARLPPRGNRQHTQSMSYHDCADKNFAMGALSTPHHSHIIFMLALPCALPWLAWHGPADDDRRPPRGVVTAVLFTNFWPAPFNVPSEISRDYDIEPCDADAI